MKHENIILGIITVILFFVTGYCITTDRLRLEKDLTYGSYKIYSFDNMNNCIIFADSSNYLQVVQLPNQKEFDSFLNSDTMKLRNVSAWKYIGYDYWKAGRLDEGDGPFYDDIGRP